MMSKNLCFRNDNEVAFVTQQELNSIPDTEIQSGDGEKEEDPPQDIEPPQKRQRFELGADNHDNDWELPSCLVEYIHKYMKSHVSEKDIKEKVLIENPAPTNIKPTPELDGYIRNLLQNNTKHVTLKQDRTLKLLHEKLRNVFGPLSKLWAVIDLEKDQYPEDESLEEMGKWFEQTVLLISQLFNSFSYHRRENVLQTLLSSNIKVNEILKDQSNVMDDSENKLLFGEEFESNLLKESKALKQSESLFSGLSQKPSSSLSSTKRLPFQKGPLFQAKNRGQGFWKSSHSRFSQSRGRGKKYSSYLKFCKRDKNFPIFKSTSNGKRSLLPKLDSRHQSGRKSEDVHRKLESFDSRSPNLKFCSRISDSFLVQANSIKSSTSSRIGGRGKIISGLRGSGNAPQGSNKRSRILNRSVSKLNFSCSKKGLRSKACDKLKEVEQLHPISSLQNGKCISSEGNASAWRSDVQVRSQGCLFLSSTSQQFSEVSKISVEGKAVSVSLPMLRAGTCSKSVHKINESANSSSEKTQHKTHNIFGRHLNIGLRSQGDREGERHSDISSYPFRVHHQFSKICCTTNPKDSVFRGGGRFFESKVESSQRESGINSLSMQNPSGGHRSDSEGCHTIGGSSLLGSYSSSSGSSAISGNAAATDTRVIFTEGLRVSDKIVTGSKGGTAMVGSKSQSVEWSISDSSPTPTNNFFGCFTPGLGGILQGSPDRGTMVNKRETDAHKSFRVKGSQASNFVFPSNVPINLVHSHTNGQHRSINIFKKDGGDSQQRIDKSKQTDLGISIATSDHNYCRIPSRNSKCRGGRNVQECEGLQRVEIEQTSISKDLQSKGNPLHRPVCFEVVSSSSPVFFMEDRSLQPGSGCATGMLESSKRVCISPLFFNREGSLESSHRSGHNYSYNTSLANTGLVSTTIKAFNEKSNPSSKITGSLGKPTGGIPFSRKKSKLATSGLDSVRKNLQAKGVSEKASSLILSSRRDGTTSHYESAWRKWSGWCSQRKVHPFRCPLADILEFLSASFEEGLEHSTIAGYRSALSAYHESVDGVSVGNHPIVSQLMAGIFNKRPPQPRYTFIWDVKTVVTYLITLESGNISDKQLTYKLAMLLALTSSARAHELSCLDTRYLVRHHTGYSFSFGNVTKSARNGKLRCPIRFEHFKENKELCVCHHIDLYLQRTSLWRTGKGFLLLGLVKPHKPVKPVTIAKWILCVMTQLGLKHIQLDLLPLLGHRHRASP